jgi:hypothetical protein
MTAPRILLIGVFCCRILFHARALRSQLVSYTMRETRVMIQGLLGMHDSVSVPV